MRLKVSPIRLLLIIVSNFLSIHVCSVFLCLHKHLLSVCCRRLSVHQPFLHWEDEEVEIDLQEDFFSFELDLVAEQLTYMDAVRERNLD